MSQRILVIGAMLFVACNSRGTAVLVTVGASGTLHGIARLHAQAVAAGQRRDFDVPMKSASIPPAVSFGIDVPDSVQGTLLVHVTAFDAHGATLATSDGSGTLGSGRRDSISVVLPAALPDGGASDAAPVVAGAIGVLGQPCATLGELACSGHVSKLPIVCGAGLTWQPNGTCSGAQACDSTPGPTQGTCEPIVMLCADRQPGDVVCNGLDRLRCGPDLVSTIAVESCSYVCTSAACIGVCAPGALRCTGNTPQACDATGTWQGATACADQACVAGACQGVCAPGAMQCAGAVPQMCDATGQWQGDTACAGGYCNGAGVCGVCASGSTRCDGNTPQSCDADGQWQGATACSGQTCVAGACSGTCAPGAKQCSNNTAQSCGADGTWQTANACSGKTCSGGDCIGVCTAGAKSCAGGTPTTCNAMGQWVLDASPCAGGYCNGAGVCGVCAAGAVRCSGQWTQYCSSAGQWVNGTQCQYVCSSGYCSGNCSPGATNGCVNNVPATCDSTGTWQPTGSPCCDGCYNGGCNVPSCGYSVCQRVPANDSYCTQHYGMYGENYYWYCQNQNQCQTFGPTESWNDWQTYSNGHGHGADVAGAWCMNYPDSC